MILSDVTYSTAMHGVRKVAMTLMFVAFVGVASAAPPVPSARLLAKADPWIAQKLAADGMSEMLVVLSEQADLSLAEQKSDKTQRGQFVHDTLRATAGRTQAPLLAMLKARGVEHRAYWVANMIWVKTDASVADELAGRTDVSRLAANPSVRMPALPAVNAVDAAPNATSAIEWGVSKIRAPEMWAAGFTGQGIVVAGADTGYSWTHPALVGKYRGWNGSSVNHNFQWHDAIHTGGGSCGANTTAPCDDSGHGTHTMGTMVGDDGTGNQVGVAPGARWIGCRNMDQGNGTPTTYAECFQWFIAPTDLADNNANPALAPHVINNSWGCPPSEGCDAAALIFLKTVVESVRAAGILIVASAGNEGPGCSSVADPIAIYAASLTVGATNSSDSLASFSNRGPVTVDGSNRLKPEIAAPGVSVRSSVPGGGYISLSGTSMAGPHVVGGAALLMSAYPALAGKPDLLQSRLVHSAVPHSAAVNCGNLSTVIPNNEYGWGRLDVKAAYDAPFAVLDVDHNGVSEASKDGVLMLRYLLGFRGNALVAGAVGTGARRTSAVDIETYIGSLLQ